MSGPCPLGTCEHPQFSHDWEEPGVRPMCCVDGCVCGKRVTSDSLPVEAPEPRVWQMHGHAADNGTWVAVGAEWWVRIHGYGPPPVPVTVTEDDDGDYMGWIDFKDDEPREPALIQHHRIFEVQFPYGSKAEVEHGRGEAVRLRISEVSS